ncbi:transcriptional regulator, TetR family [Actinoalloteichus hymeniacidonis]|uniref:Transcriptional regulator, TetR family n=1 Tax=Actinoalloteichus hymeniacidonis TaxID=340345 RepID=A0AAC9MY50_9PSEU|nr:transcriptional regulator, TetR family [Actinoalloteichus hymeniacidonis]
MVVDPVQRRRAVVEATLRLVAREGVEGASLRKVADEAGLNIGSVRHYFDNHDALLAAAAEEVGDRMGSRLAVHPPPEVRPASPAEAVATVARVVEELLPLDEAKHVEAIVLLEFMAAARRRPVLRPMSERMARDLRQVLHEVLTSVGVRDVDAETARLTALIGGLTTDVVYPHGSPTPARLRETLRFHLEQVIDRR